MLSPWGNGSIQRPVERLLNSILKEELPDSDSQVERTMSRRGFVTEIKVL